LDDVWVLVLIASVMVAFIILLKRFRALQRSGEKDSKNRMLDQISTEFHLQNGILRRRRFSLIGGFHIAVSARQLEG